MRISKKNKLTELINKILLLNIELSLFPLHNNQKLCDYFVEVLFQFNLYIRFIKQRIYNLKGKRSNQIKLIFYNNKIFE